LNQDFQPMPFYLDTYNITGTIPKAMTIFLGILLKIVVQCFTTLFSLQLLGLAKKAIRSSKKQ